MEENGKKFQNSINIIFVSLAFHIVAFFFLSKIGTINCLTEVS